MLNVAAENFEFSVACTRFVRSLYRISLRKLNPPIMFQVEALLPSFFLEKNNQSKITFYPNKKARVLGSKMLAKYIGPHQLPFNGPELSQRVSSGSGAESKMMVDESKIKKMRNQLNEVRY